MYLGSGFGSSFEDVTAEEALLTFEEALLTFEEALLIFEELLFEGLKIPVMAPSKPFTEKIGILFAEELSPPDKEEETSAEVCCEELFCVTVELDCR